MLKCQQLIIRNSKKLSFQFNKETLLRRLEARKYITENNCWLFKGPNIINKKEIYILDRNYKITRVSAYIYLGLDLENTNILVCHECKEDNCWNPKHIYLGNTSSNTLDSVRDGTFKNGNTDKTHCKNGHLLAGKNLYLHLDLNGGTHRWCRKCRKDAAARYKAKKDQSYELRSL